MATGVIKTRQTGATATLGRLGQPRVTSVTGGELTVATRPSEPGFNPLDLLFASVSACIVLSARIAASELRLIDRFETASARVTGNKAGEGPSRVGELRMAIEIVGDLDQADRQRIVDRAMELCTVSNTLKVLPEIDVVLQSPE